MDNVTAPFFTGKDLSGIDSGFRQKLEEAAKAFREYVIQEKRKNREPMQISSARRSDKQAAGGYGEPHPGKWRVD